MAGFFFTFIEKCCVAIEKNIDKKLANIISYQIWYKGCFKGKFGRGGPNLRRGVHIRWRIWTGGVHIRCDTVSSSSMFREVRGYGERQLKMIFWEEIPVELRISPLLTSCNVVRMQNKKAETVYDCVVYSTHTHISQKARKPESMVSRLPWFLWRNIDRKWIGD